MILSSPAPQFGQCCISTSKRSFSEDSLVLKLCRSVTFNILAPGVITTHYSAGFTYAAGKDSEITGALMIAPRHSVTGASLFNGFMGGAAGNETIRMRQLSIGLGYSVRF